MVAFHQKRHEKDTGGLVLNTHRSLESFPSHWNEGVELIHIEKGCATIYINDCAYHVSDGDIVFIGPGEVHQMQSDHMTGEMHVYIFTKEYLQNDWKRFVKYHAQNPYIPASHPKNGALQTLFAKLVSYSTTVSDWQPIYLKACVYNILVLLQDILQWQKLSKYERMRKHNKMERIEEIYEYVNAHYAEKISFETGAAFVNLSPYYFSRFFKESCGMTFHEYVQNYRLSKAMKMLRETNDPIIDIALRAGFGSIKSFNRIFKDILGSSPRIYRKGEI